MRDLRLRCILCVLTATVLFSSPVLAQENARETELATLEAKLHFIGKLASKYPDSGYAETWGLLDKDVRKALEQHAGDEGLRAVHRKVLLSWGTQHMKAGNPDAALGPYETLVREYGEGDEGYREAAKAAADIFHERAEAAESDEAKLAAYRSAGRYYEKIGDARETAKIRGKMIDLQAREGVRLAADNKFGEALVILTDLEKAAGGSLGTSEAASVLARIRAKTGLLSMDLLDVKTKAEVVELSPDCRVVLTALNTGGGTGESTETAWSPEPIRWLVGRYEVGIILPGEKSAAATTSVELKRDGGVVEFPRVFPKGMVYVPAMVGGRPFFIDRTEVTEAAYRSFDSGYDRPTSVKGDNLPAHGIAFKEAEAYARSVGKQLPTEKQWLWAAFGGQGTRYPWGSEPATGRCHIGKSGPGPVGGRENGKSPFGVLDMAGNVWEWLRDEHAIGGGWKYGFLEYDVGWSSGPADFIRHKKPSERVYSQPGYPHGRKYLKYQVKNRNLQEVGIRCVIEL